MTGSGPGVDVFAWVVRGTSLLEISCLFHLYTKLIGGSSDYQMVEADA
jgi:hypothetical protein